MRLFPGTFGRYHLPVLSLVRSQQTVPLLTLIGLFNLEVTSPGIRLHILLCLPQQLQVNDKVVSTLCTLDSEATLGREGSLL